MKVDLLSAVDAALQQISEEQGVSLEGFRRAALFRQIETPPKGVQAHLAVLTPFPVAQTLKRLADSGVGSVESSFRDPKLLAMRFKTCIEKNGDFEVEPSARGHLNVRATQQWFEKFSAALASDGGRLLLDARWNTQQECNRGAPASDEIAVIDLHTRPQELSALRERYLKELEYDESAQTLSEEVLLMLLGMQANPQLSCKAFLAGFTSSENIPWYFKRYASAYRQLAESKGEVTFDAEQSFEMYPRYSVWDEEKFHRSLCVYLQEFRGTLLRAPAQAGKDYYREAFAHLLKGLDLFFAFYNHPQNRQLASKQTRILIGYQGEAIEGALAGLLGGIRG